MEPLEQSAVNAFDCLEIEPDHELIIYADARDTKGAYILELLKHWHKGQE